MNARLARVAIAAWCAGAQAWSAWGQQPVTLPTHIARMYPAANRAAWQAVLDIVEQHGIRTSKINQVEQFLITRDIPIDERHFGFRADAVTGHATRGYAQLFVSVPSSAEPARLYVGSKIESTLSSGVNIGSGTVRSYNAPAPGNWVYAQVAAKLGSDGFAIPEEFRARAELARSLPPGQPTTCLERILSGRLAKDGMTQPVETHRQRFSVLIGRRELPTLVADVMIFEDGFVWPVGLTDNVPADFRAATWAGLILSRYQPARVNECAVPVKSQVTLKFKE